jgi:hypothetical protein
MKAKEEAKKSVAAEGTNDRHAREGKHASEQGGFSTQERHNSNCLLRGKGEAQRQGKQAHILLRFTQKRAQMITAAALRRPTL